MESRVKNTVKNSVAGFGGQLLTLIFSFVSRTMFVYKLGISNLGYDTLFANILSVLSIADLGITTALSYALYLPLYQKNYEKVIAILRYFKRIFIAIGTILIVVSIFITPIIQFFINVPYDVDINYIRVVFVLYAINSFSTYFFVDMRTLLTADQKGYIISVLDCVAKILIKIFQILILYLYESYTIYLLVEILINVISNVYIHLKIRRIYNFSNHKKKYSLSKNEKKYLFSDIFYISMNKIAGVGINSTDSMLISKIVGTNLLGLYSNYNLIIGTCYALIDKIILGCTASLGNLFAESDEQKEQQTLNYLQYATSTLASFLFVFLSIFVHKAIGFWLGESMILPTAPIFVTCLNQYFFMNRKYLEIIVQTRGVFKKVMPIKIVEVIINLIVSIILAVKLGMTGIFLGSTVSLLISYFLEMYILFNNTFHMNYFKYVWTQLKYFMVNIILYMIIYLMTAIFPNDSFGLFLMQVFIAGILFLALNHLIYRKDNNYVKLLQIFQQFARGIFK